MLKIRKRLLGAAGAVVAAGAIAVSGVAVASAAPHTARAAGIEKFQLMSTSATSSKLSIIGTGVFTAGGVDHSGNKVDTAVFPGGSFKIVHSKGTGSQAFNPKTCLMTIQQHGTYKLTGGTGKYAGIRGSGTYRLSILVVSARSGGKCTKTKPPVASQQIVRAAGPAKL